MTTNESGNSLDPNERKKKTARELIRSGLSTDEFFSSVGMSPDESADWLDDDEFLSYATALADKYAHANEPFVWSSLLSLVGERNIQAIRLFFSIIEKKNAAHPSPLSPDKEIESLRSDIFGEEGVGE